MEKDGWAVSTFLGNVLRRMWLFTHKHPIKFAVYSTVTCFLVFFLRGWYHPYVIWFRTNLFVFSIGVPLAFGFWALIRRRRAIVRIPLVLIAIFVAVYFQGFFFGIHRYVAMYLRYKTLNIVQLTDLPETGYERIQPRNSIYSLAHEMISESNNSPMIPNFVRIGESEHRWTIAVEPNYSFQRLLKPVEEIFSVSGTTPDPNFNAIANRIAVNFEVGENLYLGHNTAIAAIRSFNLFQYLSYEPADVMFTTDDRGEWVQVVSLIRWKGLWFPMPEFGGVIVIRQHRPSSAIAYIGSYIRLATVGTGELVKPNDLVKYRYLRGQNVLPYEVSRYIANSFRYHNGFLAPLPGYHNGDLRIPDIPGDENDQPFTVFFRLKSLGQGEDKLYHYFALQPYDEKKQGLSTSLIIPADGEKVVFAYRHNEKHGVLTGVSAIPAKVMESRKSYDWDRNRPVEHRPFIRKIGGKTRFFWLTTVVTLKDSDPNRVKGKQGDIVHFIASSLPEVAITEAARNSTVWVDSQNPQVWTEQLEKAFRPVWDK